MKIAELYRQLRERRVIRAAILYAALVWAMLQAADLAAGAGMLAEASVRWLILAGVAGFPMTLIVSWFVESPWQDSRWTAIAGDLSIIAAVSVAAGLFAWQQWFATVRVPSLQIDRIEATDTRSDTQRLADHLAGRIALAFGATNSVVVVDDAGDFRLRGTLAHNGSDLRLSLQLLNAAGDRVWSERFDDRVIDQVGLQQAAASELGSSVGLSAAALQTINDVLAACEYPPTADGVIAVANWRAIDVDSLDALIAETDHNGLLHVARALQLFDELRAAPPPRQPVLHRLALQHLSFAEQRCPTYPQIKTLRRQYTVDFDAAADE